jgi:hypothetical protein
MFNTCKNAAPVAPVKGLVNYTTYFNVNPVTLDDFVVDFTKQLQDEALIFYIGIGSMPPRKRARFRRATAIIVSPCFRLVFRHLLRMPFVVHLAIPENQRFTRVGKRSLFFTDGKSQNF